MLWQPSNKHTGYPFFRWSFSNLASQSFKSCQEFIDCLSIAKSLHRKLFKCYKCIYGERSGEDVLVFLHISSLPIHSETPTVNFKGRMRLTLSSSASSNHSIIGSSNVAPLNPGINHRSKGLLAIAAGFRKSLSMSEVCQNSLYGNVRKLKIPSLFYCCSDAHILNLLECLCPRLILALYIELGNSPMQNTMHLPRQDSYQSQFPCLPNSTHFVGVKSTD